MLKVLVADDEIHICRLICALTDWEALDMQVIDTAANGLEALSKLQQHKPDILVTDIRMPGMNGLELIEHAKNIQPTLEIVIISGYAQFDYAQSAMKFGVSDYLLKPVQRNELMETLAKLGQRCQQQTSIAAEVEQLRQNNRESALQMQEKMIDDLLSDSLTAVDAALLREHYRFEIADGCLQVFIFKYDYDLETFAQPTLRVMQSNLEKVLKKELSSLCTAKVISMRPLYAIGVLHYVPEHREKIRKALRNCLNYMQSQRLLYGDIVFSVGIGICATSAQRMEASFHSAQNAVWERIVEGTGRLYECETSLENTEHALQLRQYRAEIEQSLLESNAERANNAIDFLERMVRGVPQMRGGEIAKIVFAAAQIFFAQTEAEDVPQIKQQLFQQCENCRTTQALFLQFRTFVANWIAQREATRQNDASRPIRLAKQYVQMHYAQSLTLEEVSEQAGFSVTYFSALFKKETGEGFSKYLVRVRVEKAKELLQETSLSVAEICSMVGYNDIKHFTQTFKKITNLSPGQYRKLYG